MKQIFEDYVRLFSSHLEHEEVPKETKIAVGVLTFVLILVVFLIPFIR